MANPPLASFRAGLISSDSFSRDDDVLASYSEKEVVGLEVAHPLDLEQCVLIFRWLFLFSALFSYE